MHIAQNYRMNRQRLALTGAHCPQCGKVSLREGCPYCQAKAQEQAKVIKGDTQARPEKHITR